MKLYNISMVILLLFIAVAATQHPLNKDKCLEWHNKYRKLHQAPNLQWSDKLASDAQNWADYLAQRNLFEHDTNLNGQQGENLYASSGDSPNSCEKATTAFYNEVKDYDYSKPGFSLKTGHFTQVVWVNSKQLGVAKAFRPGGGTVLVFRYSPSGNFLRQFSENVKPPTGDSGSPTGDSGSPTGDSGSPTGDSGSTHNCLSYFVLIASGIFVVLVSAQY